MMPSVLRILDANANRAREALRVMEEAARFILNDATVSATLKQLRHDLTAALSALRGLDANRHTAGDVGTAIQTDREWRRDGVADVVQAAGKRFGEALRAIEEYGKLVEAKDESKVFAKQIESLRYRGYEVEQRLNLALGTGQARQWRLCVLISEALCPQRDWWRVARAVVDPRLGRDRVDCIQLREKSQTTRELLDRATRLVAMCRPLGVTVVINDRPDVALLSDADGVHLGQTDLPCREARKLVGRQLLIGVSTSNMDQARQAVRDGVDYCGVGPMYPTTTKHKDTLAGRGYLQQFVRSFPHTAHLAIGGIDAHNAGALIDAGAQGLAVSSVVCEASDPQSVVAALSSQLPKAPPSSPVSTS